MGEPWAATAALCIGAFAGALLVGWLARSAVHAGYLALVLVVLCVVALPQGAALDGAAPGTALVGLAAVLGAAGFALGRRFRRRREEDE